METFDTMIQPIGFQILKADSHKALDEKKDAYTHGLLVGDSSLSLDHAHASKAIMIYLTLLHMHS